MFQYSTIVLIILLVELAAVVLAWLFFSKAEIQLVEYLDESLKNRYNGIFEVSDTGSKYTYSSGGDPITLSWDIVQLQVSVNPLTATHILYFCNVV